MPEQLEIVFPTGQKIVGLAELKAKLKSKRIDMFDPVYKKQKIYDAFALADILALNGALPTDADEILFRAADGYSPTIPIAQLNTYRGYVAYQEHGRKDRWEKVAQGKAMLSPAPFYVIWPNLPANAARPEPYQLVRIEVVTFAKTYAKLFPAGVSATSKAYRGFSVFKEQCLRCHSINLQGGDVGPELNVPKNVTEYWDLKNLYAFITNPAAFRLKSKMPAFGQLPEGSIDAILDYLHYMANHKQLTAPST